MINKWQEQYRDHVAQMMRAQDATIEDDAKPDPIRYNYVYLTREMLGALLNGRSVSFYDGEYTHHLLMCEVEIEVKP